ncbi:MAG: hypothetical protein UW27_C0001G0088 [Parcubacteria group bacterium GW2011_GWA1_44_13]|uniref:Nudix hydrolase domain-containing protein n=1 Tax=Candidatus Nomurabacteria bacterium GW2011_GWB1_44_12 TaxID=1618748 RepID=A0A837I8P0_9BACT|nr:MAG: hypothetical protein UW17_C0041G0004 [Candidatus Nomurabacteria bacterium GW2011_GWD1_44_10]KKT37280.1 MAG: hypothetical protein UW25_C0001G0088 [Candidatus Nomurabacteria bacterium GW2011_GWB1_44_12]KKT38592.1 MAG: hypothetical protein UW27_C0001G0088 [Parcubacteria group bacterium GW2011_GWA1_44_13]HBB44303.1 hypothetical protein [Candidatus Yonathbacteria bacterium]
MDILQPLDKFATVIFLLKMGKDGVLRFYLARKKQDIHTNGQALVGSMKPNGYGGKLEAEDNNSLTACAIRELFSESEVTAKEEDLILAAHIRFFKEGSRDENDFFMDVSFYLLDKYIGEPAETAEMGPPQLYSVDDAPFEDMMPADERIISCIMSGKQMNGKVFYTKDLQGNRYVKKWRVSINTPKVPFF